VLHIGRVCRPFVKLAVVRSSLPVRNAVLVERKEVRRILLCKIVQSNRSAGLDVFFHHFVALQLNHIRIIGSRKKRRAFFAPVTGVANHVDLNTELVIDGFADFVIHCLGVFRSGDQVIDHVVFLFGFGSR